MTKLRAQFDVAVSSNMDGLGVPWPSASQSDGPACLVFQSREILSVWHQTIGRARRVKPLFARISAAGGDTLMLIPLTIEHRFGARVLTFPDGGVADYNAPILFPKAAHLSELEVRAIWRRLLEVIGGPDAVALEKAPADVRGTPNPLRFITSAPGSSSGHAATLDGDEMHFEKVMLHRAKDSRRKRRRLEEAGPCRLVIAETADERAHLLAAMMRQKKRRYLERDGVDGFDRPGYRTYYPALTEQCPDLVHLSALECGGALLATHWGLATPDCFYCLMLGFEDHPLSRYSPGRLLLEDLIRHAYARGIRKVDLGCGDAPWKALLGARPSPLGRARTPHSAYGWLYLHGADLRAAHRAHAPKHSGAITVSGNARGLIKRGAMSSQLRGGASSAS